MIPDAKLKSEYGLFINGSQLRMAKRSMRSVRLQATSSRAVPKLRRLMSTLW